MRATFCTPPQPSVDDGAWQPLGPRDVNQAPFAILESGTALVMTSDPHGITRSDDGGVTWMPSNRGFSDHDIRDLAVVGQKIFAAPFSAASLPPDNTWGTIDSLGFAGNWMIRAGGAGGSVFHQPIQERPWLAVVSMLAGHCAGVLPLVTQRLMAPMRMSPGPPRSSGSGSV